MRDILIKNKRLGADARSVAAVVADLFLPSCKIDFPFKAAGARGEVGATFAFGPQNFRHHRRDRGRRGASPRLSRRLLFRRRLSVRMPGEKSFDRRRSERAVKFSADHLCIQASKAPHHFLSFSLPRMQG